MAELVSIIIPVFNAEKWIAETLKSALAQTWPRKEIIVIDDGSTDNSLPIIRSFESKFVKIIEQQNTGPCVARNNAISYAQGDYIQYLDADDLLAPDKIAQQMERAEKGASSKVLLSSSMGTFFYRYRKAVFRPNPLWQDMLPVEWLIQNYTKNAYLGIHAWLTSRKLTEIAGPWDDRLWKTDADGEYFCRVVSLSSEVRFFPKSKCYYRKGIRGSLSATRIHPDLEGILHGLFIKHILSIENSIRTRTACKYLLQHWINSDFIRMPRVWDIACTLAGELDVRLTRPPLNWKFKFLKSFLGYRKTLALKIFVSNTRLNFQIGWDGLLYLLSKKIKMDSLFDA